MERRNRTAYPRQHVQQEILRGLALVAVLARAGPVEGHVPAAAAGRDDVVDGPGPDPRQAAAVGAGVPAERLPEGGAQAHVLGHRQGLTDRWPRPVVDGEPGHAVRLVQEGSPPGGPPVRPDRHPAAAGAAVPGAALVQRHEDPAGRAPGDLRDLIRVRAFAGRRSLAVGGPRRASGRPDTSGRRSPEHAPGLRPPLAARGRPSGPGRWGRSPRASGASRGPLAAALSRGGF